MVVYCEIQVKNYYLTNFGLPNITQSTSFRKGVKNIHNF